MRNRGNERISQFVARTRRLRIFHRGGEVIDHLPLAGRRVLLEVRLQAAAPLAETHQSFIDGDARYPCSKLGAPFELRPLPVNLKKCFLPHVFGVLVIASDAKREAKYTLLG